MSPPSSPPASSSTAPHALDANSPARGERGVTLRAGLLCLALALFFGYIIPIVDYRFYNTFLGATHLPPGAVGALIVLVLVINPLLRLISQRWAFSRNEVLTVYLSCLFSTLVPGVGGNNYFVSFIIGSFYFSTRENKWFDFLKGLPPWFTPALNPDGSYNKDVVEAWYNGLTAGQSIPWGAWLVPLAAWSAFMLASWILLACLSVMLRAQWGEREALAFPLLKLPLELTQDMEASQSGMMARATPLLKKPLLWIGFAIAVAVQIPNGLNGYFPDVPFITLDLPTGPLFSEAPWNQIGGVSLRVSLVTIGISYLLASEISFSFWFFFWFMKAQLIAAYYLGYPPAILPRALGSNQPLLAIFQEAGANLAYVAIILWTGREHFRHVARRALGRVTASEAERREALSYPVAFWGFFAAFAFMTAWGVAAGMSLSLALFLWTMYVVIAVVLSRVVAEAGLLFVHHTWMPLGALSHLIGIGGTSPLSTPNGLTPATVMEATTIQDYRGSLMPSFVQSFKLAHDRGIAARPLFALLFAVIIVGMVMSFSSNVRLGYEGGGLSMQSWISKAGPQMVGRNVLEMSRAQAAADPLAWVWLGVGGGLTYAMMLARSRFAWFPFHPLGYLMSNTLPLRALWLSIFFGWLAKVLITRFGGHDTYRSATPLFLGLVMGEVSMMLFWIVIDGWQGRMGHQLMPG